MASTLTKLVYHLVFSTKNRVPLITPEIADDLYGYLGGIIRAEKGILIKAGGVADHVHLLCILRPTHAIADLVRTMKSNSSRWAREQPVPGPDFGWQTGYGAFTVSTSQIDALVDYIARQVEHHRKESFQEEFRMMLRQHGIAFDERYVWD
jgi:REP element-mobilizing transposase RayT